MVLYREMDNGQVAQLQTCGWDIVVLALANVPPSCLCDWSLPVQWPMSVLFALMTVSIMIENWVSYRLATVSCDGYLFHLVLVVASPAASCCCSSFVGLAGCMSRVVIELLLFLALAVLFWARLYCVVVCC